MRAHVRKWSAPDVDAIASYATSILTEPTSLLPGLTALEAESASRYFRTLPMGRDQSVVDVWLALTPETRAAWIDRTRLDLEALR